MLEEAMKSTIQQASRSLSRLPKMAVDGEEVVLVRAGKPVAKLVPAREEMLPTKIRKPRVPGALAGRMTYAPGVFEPLTISELAGMGFE
jgi:prevent-host-death family protein